MTKGMTKADRYFMAWGLVLPITSFVVLPFVPGTTPGYMLALALALPMVNVVILPRGGSGQYYRDLLRMASIFMVLTAASQLSLAYSDYRYLANMMLVNPFDESVVLRSTMFTQSMYLLAAVSTFIFVRRFYKPSWDRYFMRGVILLALYGFYELAFFAVFRHSGDFLSNRPLGNFETGSFFQTIAIGPLVMQRLKSLTGEPSMYSVTVLPFWIYAVHVGWRRTQVILLISLLLSTSTTALLGIGVYLAIRLVLFRQADKLVWISLVSALVIVSLSWFGNDVAHDLLNNIFMRKFNLTTVSGSLRFNQFVEGFGIFWDAPVGTKAFGFGFGYTRASNMFTTLLLNVGIVGMLITCLIFLLPILRLTASEKEKGLKAALIVSFTMLMISVPEFGNLSAWLFLGIAYSSMDQQRKSEQKQPLEKNVVPRKVRSEKLAADT